MTRVPLTSFISKVFEHIDVSCIREESFENVSSIIVNYHHRFPNNKQSTHLTEFLSIAGYSITSVHPSRKIIILDDLNIHNQIAKILLLPYKPRRESLQILLQNLSQFLNLQTCIPEQKSRYS